MADLTNFESLTIDLKARTLADTCTIQTLTDAPIGTAYTGTIAGWPWGCTVRGRQAVAGRYQLTGDYDVSELLKQYITFDTGLTGAVDILTHVAGQIGKTPAIEIDDHNINPLNSQTTLMDCVSSLFSWTAAVPHRSVNVFLRSGTLYAIQRGKEIAHYSLVKTGTPTFTETLVDTLMDTSVNSPTITGDSVISTSSGSSSFFSGTISFGNSSVTYSGGLCVQSVVTDADGSVTTTAYSYSGNRYILSETVTVTGAGAGSTATTYAYGTYEGQAYMTQKLVSVHDGTGTEKSRTESAYYPLGFNFFGLQEVQYTSKKDKEGVTTTTRKASRSSISEGRPGGQASPYTISRAAKTTTTTPSVSIARNPIAAAHIPVTDTATLQRYADGLTYLDGKSQIACQVDCYDQHIVDFTELIQYAGESWYLESNRITLSAQAAGNKQTLELVRWQ